MLRFDLGTFSIAGSRPFAGVVVDGKVLALDEVATRSSDAGSLLCGTHSVLEFVERWEPNLGALRVALEGDSLGNASWVPAESLQVHMPLSPRQIFCSGANYKKHVVDLIVDSGGGPQTAHLSREERRLAAEKMMAERVAQGTPYIFTKSVAALTGPFDELEIPVYAKQADWELELVVVIGKRARHIPREHALEYVAGYSIANDMTARDYVFREDIKAMGTDWFASKCAPAFTPFGPYLTPAEFVPNPQSLQIQLKLNGEVMQDESTADMIFDVTRLIEYASSLTTLLPGDLLLTGSPAGNGTHYGRFLRPDDTLEGSISALGVQRNRCIAEQRGTAE